MNVERELSEVSRLKALLDESYRMFYCMAPEGELKSTILLNALQHGITDPRTPLSERGPSNQDGATRLGASRSASEAPNKTNEGKPMTNNSDAALRVLEGERE